MLRLMLLRHAKSNHVPGLTDLERPLTERGHREAQQVGQYLLSQHLRPELAIVSSATRTQQTWGHISAAFDASPLQITERRIYEAAVGDILNVIRDIGPGPRTVLMIGHNPGLVLTTEYLCQSANAGALGRLQTGFPPCSLTVVDLNVQAWNAVSEDSGTLERFETPETMLVT